MNVPSGSRLSPIPPYRKSPDAPLPKFKVLAIGINYRSRPDELKGPVNEVKDVKKTLEDVYHYREMDITLMTDEDENRDTELWPSAENILRAIDNLVDGASRGDVFVFYYAGHCGQHDNGEYQYIIACDDKNIMGNTLRKRLVGPLPMGSRLTVILDACHSGEFLGLGHYLCQWCSPRQRAQSLSVPPTKRTELLRRNTEDIWRVQLPPSPPFLSLPRRRFKKAITTALAVIRLKNLMETKSNEDEDDAVQHTPSTSGQQLFCGCCNRACDSTTAPNIIFLSACGKNQQTWEDTKKRGKGTTTKLLRILTEEPSIKLGDLEQRLKNCLFEQAFKRVRMATDAFRRVSVLVSPKRKEKLENKYKARGVFDFKEQNAQVGSLRPVGPDEPLLLLRAYGEDDEG